ncbi:hypothetical protein HPB50_000941 [Hyalomma asiaticum]|uniref:Uncharacterized protein n=1 Tax=Hyalomma asiaticum TaxID=266040 RepID=A0ACB7SIK1_HYAAI|nr:hypothetical protein HPB50_000941 [Hyalomma asiaticum]
MNASVEPCENFGRFVCDGWSTRHELAVRELAFVEALGSIAESLQSFALPEKQDHQDAKQKAAMLYRSCELVWRGERDELHAVRDALRSEGIVWPHKSPTPDVLRTALRSSLVLRWGAPFDIIERDVYFETLKSAFMVRDEDVFDFDTVNDLDTAAFMRLPQKVQRSRYPVALRDELIFSDLPYVTEQDWWEALGRFVTQNKTSRLVVSTRSKTYVQAVWRLWEVIGEHGMHTFLSWSVVQIAALLRQSAAAAQLLRERRDAAIDTRRLVPCQCVSHRW